MNDITLVVLCAGNSTRFDNLCKKQWIRIDNEPLWLNVTNRLTSFSNFSKTIVVSHKDELSYMKNFSDDFIYVEGGDTRQNSIKNALEFVDTPYVMISDVARACISKNIISDLIQNKNKASCIVPILDVSDTVIFEKNTINREDVKLIQKSQHKNKERAMKVLKAKLFEIEMEKKMEAEGANRKEQVGTGDRSGRIRTYNFPQNRLSDHRINLTLYRLDYILQDGLFDEVIDPLIADHQSRLIEANGL